MEYSGINVDVDLNGLEIVESYIRDLKVKHGYSYTSDFEYSESDSINVEVWWGTEFSGCSGISRNKNGERNVVTTGSYTANSVEDFILALNTYLKYDELTSDNFK